MILGSGITTYCIDPGIALTDVFVHGDTSVFPGFKELIYKIGPWILRTPTQSAQPIVHCAVDKEAGQETGLLYCNCQPITPVALGRHLTKARQAWEVSLKLVNLDKDPTQNFHTNYEINKDLEIWQDDDNYKGFFTKGELYLIYLGVFLLLYLVFYF